MLRDLRVWSYLLVSIASRRKLPHESQTPLVSRRGSHCHIVAAAGMSGVYFVRPGLHPFAYVPGCLLLAALLSNGVSFRRVPTGGTSIASSNPVKPSFVAGMLDFVARL